MKLILSTILLSTAIALVSTAPASVDIAPSASASAALTQPSVDSREEAWARMKIALPDGAFPEDKLTMERLQHQPDEKIVPMIIMSDKDFPPPSHLIKKPLYKHQRVQLDREGPAYKHMGAAASKESFDPMMVTPLLPKAQEELNEQHHREQEAEEKKVSDTEFREKGNRYKNLVAISDNGVFEHIQLPRPGRSSFPETLEIEEEVLPQGVVEKKLVGMDKMGKMRYIDVPYYNRAKQVEEA